MKTLQLFVECHVRMHVDEFVYLDLGLFVQVFVQFTIKYYCFSEKSKIFTVIMKTAISQIIIEMMETV